MTVELRKEALEGEWRAKLDGLLQHGASLQTPWRGLGCSLSHTGCSQHSTQDGPIEIGLLEGWYLLDATAVTIYATGYPQKSR